MQTLSHRDLRNNSAEVLRRAASGESMVVTNNGVPVAVVGPVNRAAIDELTDRGAVRRARRGVESLKAIVRRRVGTSSAEIVDDIRRNW
jgi:prevent-host-death family protein